MKNIINILTGSRFKSFYWRTSMMALAGFLALIADSLAGFNLSPQVTVVLGLVLGEVSKFINTKLQS